MKRIPIAWALVEQSIKGLKSLLVMVVVMILESYSQSEFLSASAPPSFAPALPSSAPTLMLSFSESNFGIVVIIDSNNAKARSYDPKHDEDPASSGSVDAAMAANC
ncbi:hypothetical protein LIER_09799 [Lithospermum erythrorhizon]|uniref:Uncharacterized protein n=1 Tax=Lithospermum erythrorhizon TaxID=34254 RepID=A0AAV3PGY5_LITER